MPGISQLIGPKSAPFENSQYEPVSERVRVYDGI
jgi:hypothetical protein